MMLSNAVMATIEHYNKALLSSKTQEEIKIDEDMVIEQFLEENDSAFSLSKITDWGFEMFGKIVGDWFGTNSISQVLKSLHSE